MIVTFMMPCPSKKIAVSYDPETEEILMQQAEILALVQLEDPDEEGEVQQIPCYMVSNQHGFFYVPELEYNFIKYVDSFYDVDIALYKERIEKIKKDYNEASVETIEIETKGKISTIKRFKKIEETDDPK